MNHQKSAWPYLIILGILLIGFPILDYSVEKQNSLEMIIESAPTEQLDQKELEVESFHATAKTITRKTPSKSNHL